VEHHSFGLSSLLQIVFGFARESLRSLLLLANLVFKLEIFMSEMIRRAYLTNRSLIRRRFAFKSQLNCSHSHFPRLPRNNVQSLLIHVNRFSTVSDSPLLPDGDQQLDEKSRNKASDNVSANSKSTPFGKKRPSFFRNPLAWTIHTVADVADVGKDVFVGGVRQTGELARGIVDHTADIVTPSLPKVYDGKLPSLLHKTLDVTDAVSSTAASTVGDGLNLISASGGAVGRAVGDGVRSMRTVPIKKKLLPSPNDKVTLEQHPLTLQKAHVDLAAEQDDEDFLSETTEVAFCFLFVEQRGRGQCVSSNKLYSGVRRCGGCC
jgi:hypothetical protein